MLNFLIKNRNGQFLLIGTFLAIIGFVLMFFNQPSSRFVFYLALFFLGFFAATHAVVDTIQSKSPNVDLLMILAAIGAVLIDFESEGATLLLIFAGAEVLEDYASNKSTNAITELMAQVPTVAQLLKANGDVVEVPTDSLEIGDVVIVARGEQIPIDGTIDRTAMINESALTGESVPVEKNNGDEAFAGTLNEGNSFHLSVTKLSDETIFSNIIRMVEEAQNRPSKISKFIDPIELTYLVTVLVIVPIFIMILYAFINLDFQESFYRGMVLLTVASPCALVASATPATLSAISNGAKNGVLFKGGAAMEALSTMDTLYTDKTGTLTFGEFRVINYELDDSLLKEVIYMEQQSSHPIGRAIVAEFPELDLNQVNQQEPVEEIAGSGIKKGDIRVGKPSVFSEFKHYQNFQRILKEGNTTIFVAKGQDMVGYFSLSDQIRPQAVKAVRSFQQEGINVSLLTGDNKETAAKVAQTVKIDNFIASMLPE